MSEQKKMDADNFGDEVDAAIRAASDMGHAISVQVAAAMLGAARSLPVGVPVGVPEGYALVPVSARWPTTPGLSGRKSDAEWEQALSERDDYHEAADILASAIAKHFDQDFGEHSNLNDPWQNALEFMREHAPSAPTVKAEQVPTPEFVWVRLLEALAGDNGCSFTASTDDYREACQPLVDLIAAGFFRNDADSLDGDIWMVAAGEQGEAAARFASCADAYAALSDVLNRVFERDDQAYDRNAERLTAEALGTGSGINMAATSIDELFDEPAPTMPAEQVQCTTCQDSGIVGHSDVCPECQDTWQPAPSLPAAGSAGEEVEVVAVVRPIGLGRVTDPVNADSLYLHCSAGDQLMTVAQHERIDGRRVAEIAKLREQIAERDAAIEEWSGTAVQNGMEVDRLNADPSAQQSAPERVSVPVELLERCVERWACCSMAQTPGAEDAWSELSALLASHGRGEA